MLIHPVRMGGMLIGAPQTYEYFKRTQDRITSFISRKTCISMEEIEKMMLETGELSKDFGTLLVGEEAVKKGLIREVGGIDLAFKKLYEMIDNTK
jgi:ATP-dependent protease ClpP protease subunit